MPDFFCRPSMTIHSAELFRREPRMFFEKTGEIKFVGKMQFFRNLIDFHITSGKKCIRPMQDTPVEKLFRGDPIFTNEGTGKGIPAEAAQIRQFSNRCRCGTSFAEPVQILKRW